VKIHLPPADAAYLAALLKRIRAVFGDALVGVYPTGSLALDGYTPGRSDLDLIAVVERASRPVLETLVARVNHEALPCPAAGLEFVLYERDALRVAGTGAGFALNLNTGRELPPKVEYGPGGEPTFWYPIDRAISRQRDGSLAGPAPRTVLPAVPFETLLPVVTDSVRAHLDGLSEHGDNAVLNGCRSLRFGTERRWYAKQSAARWAMIAEPDFRTLIVAAIASHAGGRAAGRAVAADDAREFLAVVLRRLRSAGGSTGPDRLVLQAADGDADG
jgi:hypothetical protein